MISRRDYDGPSASGAALVSRIVERSGLSQAELARRAGIPRSVLNVYVHGRRDPATGALLRISAAAGFDLELAERKPPVDRERAGRILAQVLDLAEALPFRPRAEIQSAPLADRLAAAR